MAKEYYDSKTAPWLSKHVASILALLTVVLSFVLFYILVFITLSPEKKELILYILGVLSAIDTQIFSYYFGSSKGSDIKNRMIQNTLSNLHENVDTKIDES
jgi:hypothetical protein